MPETKRAVCRHCGQPRMLRNDGTIAVHPYRGRNRCDGSGYPPDGEEADWRGRAKRAEASLAQLEDLPVFNVDGRAAVYLDDLNAVLATYQAGRGDT